MKFQKIKKGCLFFLVVWILVVTALCTIKPLGIAAGNQFSMLHRNGYFIPENSSIYTFQETKMSSGSGEYWMYGEDDVFYFAYYNCEPHDYSFIRIEDAKTNPQFNKHDITTWHYCHLPNDHE